MEYFTNKQMHTMPDSFSALLPLAPMLHGIQLRQHCSSTNKWNTSTQELKTAWAQDDMMGNVNKRAAAPGAANLRSAMESGSTPHSISSMMHAIDLRSIPVFIVEESLKSASTSCPLLAMMASISSLLPPLLLMTKIMLLPLRDLL